jgi:hypothetical protein
MGGRTIYRTMSPKRTPFEPGTNRWPHLWTVPRKRWISHTHPMWLWGYNLFKISSLGPVFYGTKWLLWGPHKLSSTFHSKCTIDKGLNTKGEAQQIIEGRSARAGRAHPLMHSFIPPFVIIGLFCRIIPFNREGEH